MILRRWVIAFAMLGATLRAADVIPIEDFARGPTFSQMKLSPDGQFFAFLRENEGKPTLFFSDTVKMKTTGVDPGHVSLPGVGLEARKEVLSFNWISDRRVVFETGFWSYFSGVTAVDRDGKHWKGLSGLDADLNTGMLFTMRTLYSFEDADQNVLMLRQRDLWGEGIHYQDVVKLSTLSGSFTTVVENPGNIVGWGVDRAGCVRLGLTLTDRLKEGCLYREREDAPWHALPLPHDSRGEIRPLGFDYSNKFFYVAALSPKRRWTIYPFDPVKGTLGEAVMDDPDYDIAPEEGLIPSVDGILLNRRIFSEQKQALAGVYYLTEGPRVHWIDPEFAADQANIDAALPKTVNLITSYTRDDKRLLVLAFSDKDPGTYYLFDAAGNTLTRIAARMDWIKPESMATMYPISYKARDGQLIHGYLTLPPGRPHKNLPFVVMPHGGPWARDVWEFNPLVQLLANRGYAVLQMNYRGSPGYGEDFYKKARHEIGRGIQDDIEDGARWAMAKGLADPKHVAIVGASYGGYSVLFALGHNPDLYCCGISIAGVTDWFALIKSRDDSENKFAHEYWVQQIGDPKNDEEFLKSISPVNFADKITAPLLIIQGKEDRIVPPKQAHLMIEALENAGHPPESLFVADEGHGFIREEDRVKEYKAIEAFLLKNLGPGAPPLESAKGESRAAAPAGGKPAG